MKNMKKTTYIVAITMVIAGLMITSAVSIPTNDQVDTIDSLTTTTMFKPISKNTQTVNPIREDGVIIFDTETDDFHPGIAGNKLGQFFVGMEANLDAAGGYIPWFLYSTDGTTWEEAGFFAESLGAQYPAADSNANGFYATFSAPTDTPGAIWAIEATDPSQPAGAVWDWSQYDMSDFEFNSISCYTRAEESWNFGCIAFTGYHQYEGADVPGMPYILYPTSETSGTISWLNNAQGYVHADVAIDEVKEMCYSAYDHETTNKLKLRKTNFATWSGTSHTTVWSKDIGDGTTHLQNMAVEANNNSVLVVAESDGDIICLYSTNGGTAFTQSTVVTGALYPDIILSPDGNFICSYIKTGVLYTKTTEDGGATWGTEAQVADSEVQEEYRASNMAQGQTRAYAVWEDTRAEDIDIFFASAGAEAQIPILEVAIQAGIGIGAKATVTNVGTGPATNVEYSIHVTGGILGRIDKEVPGTAATLAVGESVAMSSGMIIGLGAISVDASATCTEGSSDSATASGTQIIILTKVN